MDTEFAAIRNFGARCNYRTCNSPHFGALIFGFPAEGKKRCQWVLATPHLVQLVFASLCVQHRRTAFASCDLQPENVHNLQPKRARINDCTSFRGDRLFLLGVASPEAMAEGDLDGDFYYGVGKLELPGLVYHWSIDCACPCPIRRAP